MLFSLLQDATLLGTILVVLPPALSFIGIVIFTRARPRLSAGLSIGAVSISLISALCLIINHWHLARPLEHAGRWLVSGDIFIPFGFLLDPLSLLMLTLVAVISFLVQIYSLGYMAGDTGFSRYYAFQSLFACVMMALSISSSLLQLYVFWELVGLSSYFLIGFWHEKFSATQAGKKAFVMTRLGDVSLFLGLILVLINFGNPNILEMNSPELAARMAQGQVTLCALLIFGGIIGKSAQFPLMTWLPDAMEGPTPVSALLHSATMVAAGVFLFARLFPFFIHSETAIPVFLAIGAITMLMGATMALVDRDIKKVWAYSTISQLGFMIMGLAAGGYFAGTFHLTTHAGFKGLLFLCSGVWIHQYGTNDMNDIGRRGGRRLKIPMICMILAAASLSGLPPLSGFFSKEAVMGAIADLRNPVWLMAGLLGVFLTPYYAFRPVFIILFSSRIDQVAKQEGGARDSYQRIPHQLDGHSRKTIYRTMAFPLIILAGMTLVLGFFQAPLKDFLMHGSGMGHPAEAGGEWLAAICIVTAFLGVILAWFEFGRKGASQVGFAEKIPALNTLFRERWYLDHFYRRFVDIFVYKTLSNLSAFNERKVIDDGIDALCRFTKGSGRIMSYMQSAKLRYNLFVMFAALVLMVFYFVFENRLF